jgi:hypothetical protein
VLAESHIDQGHLAWFGGTYALRSTLDLTAAYYREWQNDFSGGAKNAAKGTCALVTTALASCAGTLDGARLAVRPEVGYLHRHAVLAAARRSG